MPWQAIVCAKHCLALPKWRKQHLAYSLPWGTQVDTTSINCCQNEQQRLTCAKLYFFTIFFRIFLCLVLKMSVLNIAIRHKLFIIWTVFCIRNPYRQDLTEDKWCLFPLFTMFLFTAKGAAQGHTKKGEKKPAIRWAIKKKGKFERRCFENVQTLNLFLSAGFWQCLRTLSYQMPHMLYWHHYCGFRTQWQHCIAEWLPLWLVLLSVTWVSYFRWTQRLSSCVALDIQ